MFVEAIDKVRQYTRPIHIISRQYGLNEIIAGSGTMFFVNEFGDAITCAHVAQVIYAAQHINEKYKTFAGERYKIKNDPQEPLLLQRLEQEHGYEIGTVIGQQYSFPKSVLNYDAIQITMQGKYDLALLRFKNFNQKLYDGHAVFLKDSTLAKQGKSLCRYGYPFTEFTNFRYNSDTDDIEWTQQGLTETPAFPIDGMLTRHLGHLDGTHWGIEMSTPGLRGQSGSPLFDTNGIVFGLQSSTRHLHLGFDVINQEVRLDAGRAMVSNHPFLHVGQCIHVDIIKNFLRSQNVPFYEQ